MLVGAFSVITNLRMELFQALVFTVLRFTITDILRYRGRILLLATDFQRFFCAPLYFIDPY